jgi:hypothetical protein
VLFDNRAVLLPVGLGLKLESGKGPDNDAVLLQHDFSTSWNVREITSMEELELDDLPRLKARWTVLKCCFT